eukprot:TRINITY_DN70401_c0_g1_i1.p1 TRINITY_DN70401_c0_g1~~TRINITY_DN70401_c0_g1_i1.p1  ORF type:complete len:608 (-),score=137.76 TRINITY_DN70401_c0_g1_i1:121-1944(-)
MVSIPFGKILLSLLVGYVALEVYQLYNHCQPEVVPADHPDAVSWDLAKSPPLDLYVAFSTSKASPTDLGNLDKKYVLVGRWQNVIANSEEAPETIATGKLEELPKSFFKNKTIYLHAVATVAGQPGQVVRNHASPLSRVVLHQDSKEPTRYLTSQNENEAPALQEPIMSLPRAVEVGFVMEARPVSKKNLASKGLTNFVKGNQFFLPLSVNTLVSPRDEYMPLRSDAEPPSVELRFSRIGMAYWTLQYQLGLSFDEAERLYGVNSYDIDSFKQMIGGSSPWKIIIVYSITILHFIFEYLAFSNDIQFWRSKTSFEGLSSTSVAMQAGMSIISLLYVIEVRQSKIAMYFIMFRMCLHFWKLSKMTTLKSSPSFPFVEWVNRQGVSDQMEEMQEVYEDEKKCMRYLMLVLLPIIAIVCGYRLVNHRYRSWYSWIILSLAICSQTAGFVVMTPQVFMNYRLKSVDHLPWRVLSYQAVNTFIDDVFMLCIRMPEVQKYSVFRDDIVFIICCIQRWMYKGRRSVEAPSSTKEEAQEELLQTTEEMAASAAAVSDASKAPDSAKDQELRARGGQKAKEAEGQAAAGAGTTSKSATDPTDKENSANRGNAKKTE